MPHVSGCGDAIPKEKPAATLVVDDITWGLFIGQNGPMGTLVQYEGPGLCGASSEQTEDLKQEAAMDAQEQCHADMVLASVRLSQF